MERVVAYVDGYNLYYGLKSRNWRRFYWLNIQEMARQLLKPDQQLMTTKYFTTIVKRPSDKQRRQAIYLDALRTLNGMEFYYGHFLAETIKCRHCGHSYETHHEKMTDVNISVELMADAFQDAFDVALLVSADSDLVGPARTIRHTDFMLRTTQPFARSPYGNLGKSWWMSVSGGGCGQRESVYNLPQINFGPSMEADIIWNCLS
ncbi:MAG: NYN domain-containing protein [Chloroflexota bacterium]